MEAKRIFWLGCGTILLAFGLGGFAAAASGHRTLVPNYLTFDAPLAAIHVMTGAASIIIGMISMRRNRSEAFVAAIATFFLALGVLGLLSPTLFGLPTRLGLGFRLDVIENSAHLVLGTWGAYEASRRV